MADKKVTQLSAITKLSGDDLLYVVNTPSTNPSSNKVTVNNLFGNVVVNTSISGTFETIADATLGGSSVTITANTTVKGVNLLDALNNTYQIANADSKFTSFAYTEQYLQVSNANFMTSNSSSNGTLNSLEANTIAISNGHGLTINAGGVGNMIPATSNATTEGIQAGTIWFSNTHLYIATDTNTIKRVALTTF